MFKAVEVEDCSPDYHVHEPTKVVWVNCNVGMCQIYGLEIHNECVIQRGPTVTSWIIICTTGWICPP